VIRAGQPGDLPRIMAIRTGVAENHLSVEQMAAIGITEASITQEMAAGDLACFVAEEAGVVTGFAMADRRDASLFALFMDGAHEGKGHGSALLAACEGWLKAQGHAEASLATGRDTRAFAFYLRRGWRETAEVAGHFEEDAVRRKAL